MSSREVRVFWETLTHRCVLMLVDGYYELRLYEGEHTRRLATCRDVPEAASMAERWRAETGPVR